MIQLIINAF